MSENKKIKLNQSAAKKRILLAAAIWWLLSFALEPLIFDVSCRREQWVNYLLVKGLLFPVLMLIVTYLYNLFSGILSREANVETRSTLYAVPVWIIVGAVWAYRGFPFRPEEFAIATSAAAYDTMNDVFTYITSYVEMLALMIVPNIYGIAVMKILILGLEVGYAVSRACALFHTKLPFLIYAGFLVPPGLLQSYSVHRSPMYGMLYFFLAVKLFCDWKEEKKPEKRDLLIVGLAIALLTWWRSEGIYFLVFGPVVMMLAYRIRFRKKTVAKICALMLLLQGAVFLPTTKAEQLTVENYGKHKTTPFFNYALTGMLCNGLDREKNAELLNEIEHYMHIDFIDILNAMYGEHIYDEGHATYHKDYTASNPDADDEDVAVYEKNVTRLILRNPLVFIKAQIHAFSHVSFHYDGLCLSAVFGNLWAVVLWLAAIAVWAAVKKKWFVFWLFLCPIAHGCITTVFLPAAYFKYYYPEYLFTWLTVPIMISWFVSHRKESAL